MCAKLPSTYLLLQCIRLMGVDCRCMLHASLHHASCHAGSRQVCTSTMDAVPHGLATLALSQLNCTVHTHAWLLNRTMHTYTGLIMYKCDDTYIGVYINIYDVLVHVFVACVVVKIKAVVSTWKPYLTLSFPNQQGLQVVSVAYPIVSSLSLASR